MMNKKLLSLAFALCSCATLSAQDLIVKTDATQVEARVLEISPEQIRYKRFSNPDGPTYVLPIEAVDYIRYANGDTDRFRPETQQPATPTEEELARMPQTLPADPPHYVMPVPDSSRPAPAPQEPAQTPQTLPADPPRYVMPVPDSSRPAPAPQDPAQTPQTLPADPPRYVMPVPGQPQPATPTEEELARTPQTLPANPPYPVAPVPQQTQPAQQAPAYPYYGFPPGYVPRQFSVGDYYDENGLRGVVCFVDETRMHGLIISLEEAYVRWNEFDKTDLRNAGANDLDNGEINMETIAAYIAANGLTWDDFPAFKWCREQGDGWYLPAVNELLSIGNHFNGGTRKYDRQARNRFNDNLKEHGGHRMQRLGYYFSSTEKDEKMAYTSHMDVEPPFVNDIAKNTKFFVRAVHRF